MNAIPASVTEVVLVDGDSSDDSVAIAQQLRPGVMVLNQQTPGKGAAMVEGMFAATGDIVVLCDTDDSMNPAELERFVAALLAGADVVHGSRTMNGGGSDDLTQLRSLGNKALTTLTNMLFSASLTDLCYGYVAMWSDVIDLLRLDHIVQVPHHPMSDEAGALHRPRGYGHGFEIEALLLCRSAKLGLKISEVSSHESARRHGSSNLRVFGDGFRVLDAIVREWRGSEAAQLAAGVRDGLRGRMTARLAANPFPQLD